MLRDGLDSPASGSFRAAWAVPRLALARAAWAVPRLALARAAWAVLGLALALATRALPAPAVEILDGTEVGIRWEAASGPVTHYRLWVSEDGGSFLPRADDGIPGTETTFSGRSGVRYRLAVTAHDGDGRTGPPSPASVEFAFGEVSSQDGSGSEAEGDGGAGFAAAASLLMSFAPPPAAAPAAASALVMPYAVNGADETTVLTVALEGGAPGLLQVHLLDHTPIASGTSPGESPSDPTFSFTCPVEPAAAASIVIARGGSEGDGRAGIVARCGAGGDDRSFEIAVPPGGAVAGFALVGLLDPDRPTRSRIEDRLHGQWTHLDFGQGGAYSGQAWPLPAGADGDSAPGAHDFRFRLDGSEFATLRFEPDLADRDSDGVRDFVDLCPDVAGQDDDLDRDGDTIPDDCDRCPDADDVALLGTGLTNVPSRDTDGSGVPLWCSACVPIDLADGDGDGTPDTCDRCPGSDDLLDADGDGAPDACDLCPGGDDALDQDGDGVPDACDLCPGSDDAEDADGDGVPDACACPCFDRNDVLDLQPLACRSGGAILTGARGNALAFPGYCSYRTHSSSRVESGADPRIGACPGIVRDAAQQAGVVCY